MSDRSSPHDGWLDRRIPLGCPATVRPAHRASVQGECVDLGVHGMTLRVAYVPAEAEVFEVTVMSPEGVVSRPPLVARVEVCRCHAVGDGTYEIGAVIVAIVG